VTILTRPSVLPGGDKCHSIPRYTLPLMNESPEKPDNQSLHPFERLMLAVSQAVNEARRSESTSEDPGVKIETMIDDYLRKMAAQGVIFPPKGILKGRAGLEYLKSVPERIRESTKPGIHPLVWHLLYLNFQYLQETVGTDVANEVIAGTMAAFTIGAKKPRGRPTKLPFGSSRETTFGRQTRLPDARTVFGWTRAWNTLSFVQASDIPISAPGSRNIEDCWRMQC
jgi:hypothetical protein